MLIVVLTLAITASNHQNINQKELQCMKRAIYEEARGESYDGKRAVANVIMNRVKHEDFPSTVCGVVYQRNRGTCQFSWVCKEPNFSSIRKPKNPNKKTVYNSEIEEIAKKAITAKRRKDNTHGSLYFRTKHVPGWMGSERIKKIGNHYFYISEENYGRKESAKEGSRSG